MTGGCMGEVLVVNLSDCDSEKQEVPEDVYRDFIGGYGLGAWYIYRGQPKGVDPMGDKAVLGFLPGLLGGTSVPFSGRFMIAGKSPLTGGWGDSNGGGHLSPAIKAAGYDGIFVTGVSPDPVYVVIRGKKVEIKSASHLWGKDTVETEEIIRRETGDPRLRVACIGPAGEKRSLLSGVVTEGGKSASGSGLGAVMGSKGLKALAVSGRRETPLARALELGELNRHYLDGYGRSSYLGRAAARRIRILSSLPRFVPSRLWRKAPVLKELLRAYGTAAWTTAAVGLGDCPVGNFAGGGFVDFPFNGRAGAVSGWELERYRVRRYHCHDCPLGCGGIYVLEEGPYAVEQSLGPGYRALAALGPDCMCSDLKAILYMNDLLNRACMDVEAAGVVLSFAMECFEKGVISTADTGGLELTWGNSRAMVEMARKMIRREGLGEILADGVDRAALSLGKGCEEWAMSAGGNELAMHDPRRDPAVGLSYVVEPVPGRVGIYGAPRAEVQELEFDMEEAGGLAPEFTGGGGGEREGSGRALALRNHWSRLLDCSGLCRLGAATSELPLVEWLNAVTGWDRDFAFYLEAGERIDAIRQCFNAREGIRPENIGLPNRARGVPPLEKGPLAGVTIDIESSLHAYHEAIEYDPEKGWPSERKLRRLGMVWCLPGKGQRMQFFR
ncbi:MAG: aldehyde ferredoxin oxidoreductase C-terminal domain-containing protein [Actinomycetota bacterium]|nr:aldehyde ferredoxin oxidoreductase C-terminal domain-containing protein [Actinomycetota bacterium]